MQDRFPGSGTRHLVAGYVAGWTTYTLIMFIKQYLNRSSREQVQNIE
jgi:hypothetical protein